MIILLLCFMSVIIVGFLFSRIYNPDNTNKNTYEDNNEDIIDKNYIKKEYGNFLIYPLMGQNNKFDKSFVFFINKNNAMDIKLPYEFLSPIKTCENDDALFYLDIDENYYCMVMQDYSPNSYAKFGPTYNNWNRSDDYFLFNGLLDYYKTITCNFTSSYTIDYSCFSSISPLTKCLKSLINQYNLNSQTLVDFYYLLIKKKQPTLEEMYDILIKFEKSKEEINRIDNINHHQKLNTMLEDAEKSSFKDEKYDNIDKELMNLVNSNKKGDQN